MLRTLMCLPLWTLAISTIGLAGSTGAEVSWYRDLRQAAAEASRVKKPMLVEFTADWCGYCRQMKQTTFADEGVIRHVNGCFVPVAVDADQHGALMQAVGVEGLPTTLIISPELRVVKRIAGYQSPEQLREHLGAICRHDEASADAAAPAGRSPAEPPRPAPVGAKPVELAFQQVCLVSLLDEHALRRGDPAWTATRKGRTVCFASAEHQRRFERDPDAYWPVLDGRCVVSAAENRAIRPGDVRLALIHRGRVWLFADRERQLQFLRTPGDYAARRVN